MQIVIDQAVVEGYKDALTESLTLLSEAYRQRDALAKQAESDQLLTMETARAYLGGISEDTLLYYRRLGLDFIKKGKAVWYRKGDIDDWLATGKVNRHQR